MLITAKIQPAFAILCTGDSKLYLLSANERKNCDDIYFCANAISICPTQIVLNKLVAIFMTKYALVVHSMQEPTGSGFSIPGRIGSPDPAGRIEPDRIPDIKSMFFVGRIGPDWTGSDRIRTNKTINETSEIVILTIFQLLHCNSQATIL